jgi:hypothetical protein
MGQWTVFPCAPSQNFARLSAPSGFSGCSAFIRSNGKKEEKRKTQKKEKKNF